MPATEVTANGMRHMPEHDRMSTILGNPCRIMQPLGTPKRQEDCQPFTFKMSDYKYADKPAQAKLFPKLEKAATTGKAPKTTRNTFGAKISPTLQYRLYTEAMRAA